MQMKKENRIKLSTVHEQPSSIETDFKPFTYTDTNMCIICESKPNLITCFRCAMVEHLNKTHIPAACLPNNLAKAHRNYEFHFCTNFFFFSHSFRLL